MIKFHQFLYLFFIFKLHSAVFAVILNPPQTLDQHIFTPQNTVFMFDVDGVLAERGFWKNWDSYWALIKECTWWELIQFLGWHVWHLPTLLITLNHQDITTYLDTLALKWPLLNKQTPTGTILERLKATINQGSPKKETIAILLNLYHQGFPITITTNQARITFDYLVRSHVLPDFSYYTLIYTADYCPCLPYIKKPKREYYQCFKKTLAQKGIIPEYFIFIDDTYENVLAASQQNIISILFNNNTLKHPAQELEKDLASLGIYVNGEVSKEKSREKISAFDF